MSSITLPNGTKLETTPFIEQNKDIEVSKIVTLEPITDVSSFGAINTGLVDVTEFIQAALNFGKNILIPDGIYLVDATKHLIPQSNSKITLSKNAILKVIPNDQPLYRVFDIVNKENIEITGGQIVGDRDEHIGTGEWGHGINIHGSSNVKISDTTISDCWGDGIYIGKSDTQHSNTVFINNIKAVNNRRQGLTLADGSFITITNSSFGYTNGTNPQAGIDIEPNADCYVKNVLIENVHCDNNTGTGIQILGTMGSISNVTLNKVVSSVNAGNGLLLDTANAINIYDCNFDGCNFGVYAPKNIYDINFYNCTSRLNTGVGVSLTLTASQSIISKNIHFYNCDFSSNTNHNFSLNSSDYINFPAKNVTLSNCRSTNSGARGISIAFGGSYADNVQINNCISENNVSADVIPPNVRILDLGYNIGSAYPTTGTWSRGTIIKNTNAISGQNAFWYCSTGNAAGGVWEQVGIIGASKMASQANSSAADVAGIVSDFNALLSKLKASKLMA